MVVPGPFEKFELTDEHRLQPPAFRHLGLREPLSPTAAPLFGKVHERAVGDLKTFEPPEQLRTAVGDGPDLCGFAGSAR